MKFLKNHFHNHLLIVIRTLYLSVYKQEAYQKTTENFSVNYKFFRGSSDQNISSPYQYNLQEWNQLIENLPEFCIIVFLGYQNFLRRPQETIGSQKLKMKKFPKIMTNPQKIMRTDPFENILP